MYYRLVFSKKSTFNYSLKIALLICGLISDITVLFSFFLSIFATPFYLILMFLGLGVSIGTRIYAIKLVFKVENKLQNGKLTISKLYPHKKELVLEEEIANLQVFPMNDYESESTSENEADGTQSVIIDLASDEKEKYLIVAMDKKVLCNLDKYLYATLLKGEVI